MSHGLSISILLRTFNSAKTLDKVISRLDLQEGDEVLVVDSGSTDSTLEIAKKHGATVLKAEGKFNYSKSLNIGFRAAKTPWVLVLSSHSLPTVENLLAIYREEAAKLPEDVVVAYGPNGLYNKPYPWLEARYTTIYSKADAGHRAAITGGNGNALYRRTMWEQLSFDEGIRTGEDQLWKNRIQELGYRYAYVPAAQTVNENRGSLLYMFRKGRSEARTHRSPKHQPMRLLHFAGALKNHTLTRLRGEISWGNFTRYGAHIVGQFFGSRMSEDNTPE